MTYWWEAEGGSTSEDGFAHAPDGAVWCRILNRNVVEASEETYSIRLELSPIMVEPTSTPAEATVVSAVLTIGSAAYLGIGADRHQHYASQVGATLPTLVVGKQYRLVAQVIDNLNSPLNHYDNMDGASYGAFAGAASGTIIDAPGYTWTPGDGTSTSEGDYSGISFVYAPTHAVGAFGPGATFTGDWLTFNGPPVVADIGIGGTGISGFYGFYWVVALRLERRDAP